jgi:hypothetical protein
MPEILQIVAIMTYNCRSSVVSQLETIMFVKHGDGKIMSVIDEEELTDAQKKATKDLSDKTVKSGNQADASSTKKSGS